MLALLTGFKDSDDAFGARSFICFTGKLGASYGNLFLETQCE